MKSSGLIGLLREEESTRFPIGLDQREDYATSW